jgi:transcriptional regulator with XRE-family HTH domain
MKAQQNLKYRFLPTFLREMREQANLTQRELGKRLNKPQSWVYNCETGNRRVDITEFILWAKNCEIDPKKAFSRLLKELE